MAQSVSIGTAWTEAAGFVAREKRLLAPLVLALMVVPATVSQLTRPGNPFDGSDALRPWIAIALLALLIGLVGQMAVIRLAMGADRSLGATIGLALRRLPATLGAFFLFVLALSLVLIPSILVVTLASGGQAAGGFNGLTLLVMLALSPRILLVPALAMDEPRGPWALVKTSWAATRGQYWRLLMFFLLLLISSLVFAVAVSSVVGSFATLALGKPEPLSVSRLLVALAGGTVQAVIATVYAAMIGRLVVQLRSGPTSGI